VTAIDANAGTVLTYSIIGGADAAKFTINAITGALSFISAPDFEASTDAGTNNIYDVVIQVSDGTLTDTQAIAVTVTDQSEVVTVTLINGTSSNDVLNGSAGVDKINGLGGNDIIEGKGGADILDGGAGIDTVSYASSAAGVTVTLNGATATIGSGGDAQGDSIKNFENIIGSGFNDTLTGNGAANVIDGGAGADTMAGGAGNDTYVVDNAGDTIIEAASAGTDLVKASITYSLAGSNLENLTLTGSGNINATGNTLANILTGNSGNNRLDGGAGADTMVGGLGDDTYVVDVTGDKVTEVAGQGTDTIETSLASFSLAALTAVENLTYTGALNFSGIGNALANRITGGAGNDTFTGGAGGDTFVFNLAAFGDDKITDYQDGLDKLSFSLSVADSFDDFVITGNGTKTVMVTHGTDSIIVTSAVAFTLAADDFIFV
jgi:Ca2+-binding RTX toxin-like protein